MRGAEESRADGGARSRVSLEASHSGSFRRSHTLEAARVGRPLPPEFVALAAGGVAPGALLTALADADHAGCEPFDALLASGALPERDLVGRLARGLGVALYDTELAPPAPIDAETFANAMRTGTLALSDADARQVMVVAARGLSVAGLARLSALHATEGGRVALLGPADFADLTIACAGRALAEAASTGPALVAPELTVAHGMPKIDARARTLLFVVAVAVVVAAFVSPMVFAACASAVGGLFFVMNAFRLAIALTPARPERPLLLRSEQSLPIYTVLVALAREAAIVPDLLDALERLDYPPAKLDIKLLVEADDRETLGALDARPPRAGIEVLKLPPGGPRTKPRALNAGLMAARGRFLTVFDAEDRPEPDQLRRALDAFGTSPETVACVQARLAIDNHGDGWLARQFRIEYAALFDVVVPALAALDLPIPLGGTSNHFRTAALRTVGGWDAGNVTEDADLGLRLARRGWSTRAVDSVTWEEAPATPGLWIRQRTRWMKGYMVTAVVHGRRSGDLVRRLGVRRFVAAHLVVGGVAATALAYPAVVVGLLVALCTGALLAPSASLAEQTLATFHVTNLLAGYAVGLACGWIGVDRRGPSSLAVDLLTMPFYWLLVGVAAWRALGQIVFDSATHWEKTAHGLSSRRASGAQR
ncbi:glycosyltransferase [Methylopila sp. 73B]|uniref:glycosyltransferase n=1 Tax=Methylopila sp. 73B TaxID=1120792 RepID=UPI000377A242|nr:glycosyltransferase [Methylopila sp. 73B]